MITLCASLLHKSTLKKGLGSQGIDKEAQEEHAGGDEQPVQTLLGAALPLSLSMDIFGAGHERGMGS